MTAHDDFGRTMTRRRPGAPAAIVVVFLSLGLLASACGSKNNAGSAAAASVMPPSPSAVPATSQPPRSRAAATPVATPTGASVTIDNFSFTPATITIPVGATVTWTNHDAVPHTVTASDKSFTSQNIDSDAQFSHTFTASGTFSYSCTIHPFMMAKVIVQ